ncbi:MAG TPA: CDP-alcohol phosphatidyltransferase family protein [Acidimicrobiales bacterium]|nr:CDP-alcohol phosphatidyltransferase family protein [Acidimicrobiales bacterium]
MIDGRRAGRDAEPGAARRLATRFSLGPLLVRLGVPADAVTVLGVVLAAGNAVLIGRGDFYPAVALVIVGGLMDTLDGSVAKAAGTASSRGAFFDSVADRVADALLFGAVAYYLVGHGDPRLALVPVAILAVSSIISYERAKAESLGLSARGGLMERAERLILLGIALFFHVVLLPLLWVLLGLSSATAAGRFWRVWRQASGRQVGERAPWHEHGLTVWRAAPRRPGGRRARRSREPLARKLRGVLASDWERVGERRRANGRQRSERALRRRLGERH